jgi:hypothetical protein
MSEYEIPEFYNLAPEVQKALLEMLEHVFREVCVEPLTPDRLKVEHLIEETRHSDAWEGEDDGS